ncbi:MAG: class I SAM-dependent methyltransferase [Solirubrobacterales bacterium]
MSTAIWHDVECGAYAADLGLWDELVAVRGSRTLELGCGTGRVSLHLARRGHDVCGLDIDPALVAVFNQRAGDLPAQAVVANATDFDLDQTFGLVLAPMQFLQLLASPQARIRCLSRAAEHLEPGGKVAVAIADAVLAGVNPQAEDSGFGTQMTPDAHEIDSWIYSSLPLETVVGDEEIVVRRLRQTVSPAGDLAEHLDEVRLSVLDPRIVESEAKSAGLRPAGRRVIPATEMHVGSTAVLLERDE